MNTPSSSLPFRVAIVGGGISGLAAAHKLVEERTRLPRPLEIHLFESDSRLGGVISTERKEGFLLEGGPDSFISEKPWALALARRIGLGEELIGTNPLFRRSFIVRQGKLHPVPEGFYLLAPSQLRPFVTTPIFSWPGKLRMGLDLLLPRREAGNPPGDESLASFVRRRFGRQALERMAQPMVGGIYTADPEELSLRATMPQFLEWEQQYRSLIIAMVQRRKKMRAYLKEKASGPRYGLFVSLKGGMNQLVTTLEKRLSPAIIHLNSKVTALGKISSTGRWILRRGDKAFEFDAVCLALPAFASAALVEPLDPELAGCLHGIKYASTATVNLAYRQTDVPHRLDGFGFVVPVIENRELLACTFGNVKFAGRAPEGYVLLRAFMGGALQPAVFEMEDNELQGAVRRNLKDLLGIRAQPLFSRVERHPQSMAQYRVGHLDLLQKIETHLENLPGLFLAGNGFTGIGVPDCIRRAEECALAIRNRIIPHVAVI